MNKTSLLLATMVFLWMVPSSQSAETDRQESYMRKVEVEVEEWNDRILQLQKRSESAGAKTRSKLQSHILALNDKLNLIRSRMSNEKDRGEKTWSAWRRETDEAMHDLKRLYRKTTSLVRTNEKEEPQ